MRRYPPILEYHKVGLHKGDHVPTVSPQAFERQLALLKRWGVQVWPLGDLVEAWRAGRRLPWRCTAITFDDGYLETYTIAWPLLKRYGFPATVFVSVSEVGTPGFTTWTQLQAMAHDGFTIGSHTVRHAYVPDTPLAQVREEFTVSKQLIERALGRAAALLSYPIGGFTREAQQCAREAGYAAAFTTNRAFQRQGLDPYAIRRVKITDKDVHAWILAAKLSGYYDTFRRLPAPA